VQPLPPPENGGESPPSLRQPGVWLTGGSFLGQPVVSFDGILLRFSRSASDPAIAEANIARIQFQDLPADMVEALQSNRPGLLLKTGDFVDGDMRELRNGRVELNSVLLGLKTFRVNQVLAAVFREIRPRDAQFEIRTQHDSLFRVDHVRLTEDPMEVITEIRRVD
jgi:hypothetical protein